MDAFERLLDSLSRRRVRFVIIGLSGANYYARSAAALFATQDRALFLPPEPDNTVAAWRVCEALELDLLCGPEPLDRPRDRDLAERVIANRALVRATDGAGLDIDFTLVMAGFRFERVWAGRRIFRVDDVTIPVAIETAGWTRQGSPVPRDPCRCDPRPDRVSAPKQNGGQPQPSASPQGATAKASAMIPIALIA